MGFEEKDIKLKDGRSAHFRSPSDADAEEMLGFIRKASGETDYLLKFEEEYDTYSL